MVCNNDEFMLAQTTRKCANMSTIVGEAYALLEAIHMTRNKGWQYVVFESDSQLLFETIESHSKVAFEVSAIIF